MYQDFCHYHWTHTVTVCQKQLFLTHCKSLCSLTMEKSSYILVMFLNSQSQIHYFSNFSHAKPTFEVIGVAESVKLFIILPLPSPPPPAPPPPPPPPPCCTYRSMWLTHCFVTTFPCVHVWWCICLVPLNVWSVLLSGSPLPIFYFRKWHKTASAVQLQCCAVFVNHAVICSNVHWLTISAICQANISEKAHCIVIRPLTWLPHVYCCELAV